MQLTKQPKRRYSRPHKTSTKVLQAAHKRGQELSAIQWIEDPTERYLAEAVFQRSYVSKKLLAREPTLQQTTWPEYGYMTPLERTQRFANEYVAAYRRQWTSVDPLQAGNKQPLAGNLGRISVGELNSLWRARQAADERGMPYDVFLDALMARKLGSKKELHLPRPNQLLSDKLFHPRLRGLPTREQIAERLFKPDWDRRFFQPREDNDPVQVAALEQLRVDVLRADSPKHRLAKYLLTRGLLSKDHAYNLFWRQQELVDEAWRIANPRIETAVPQATFKPGCFGYRNPDLAVCMDCSTSTGCKGFKIKSAHATRRKTGSSDPRLAHRRHLDRERQRSRRRRLKEADVTLPLKA
jgi:hypothetical protein